MRLLWIGVAGRQVLLAASLLSLVLPHIYLLQILHHKPPWAFEPGELFTFLGESESYYTMETQLVAQNFKNKQRTFIFQFSNVQNYSLQNWLSMENKSQQDWVRKSFIAGLCYYRFDYRFADLEIGHSLCNVYLGMAAVLAKQSCLIYFIF